MIVEDVDIQISLSSEWWRDPPYCEIYVDDKIIDRLHITTKQIDRVKRQVFFRGNLDYGNHTLTIRFLNKKPDDSFYDEDGNMIYDQQIIIDHIVINKLPIFLGRSNKDENFCFLKDNNNLTPYVGSVLFDNCEWIMKFSVPTYIWLMENL